MSLILDALRRAERERHLGQTPGVAQVTTAAQPPPRRPRRAWIAAGLTACLLAGLAALLIPSRKPASTLEAFATDAPVAPPAPVTEPPATLPPTAAAPTGVAGADVVRLEDVVDPTLADETGAETEAAEAESIESIEPAGAPVENTPQAEASAEAPFPEPGEPGPGEKRLRDMPSAYRADFPVLNVDVHVYDARPTRRWVMLNGRRYREGEKLGEGPQIVEIVEDGIVFDYRGERVLHPAGR